MKFFAEAGLPTRYGDFRVLVWPAEKGQEPVAIVTRTIDPSKSVLVRVHSECLTGDVFGSLRCDCCIQKEEALKLIAESDNGILIYLRQEGRGMGLFDKIRSYKLQEDGIDTHQASILLGHEPDSRDYSFATKILKELSVSKIRLLTNNPDKVSSIFGSGFEVEKVPHIVETNEHNRNYFEIKKKKFKHTFGEIDDYYYIGFTYSNPSTDISDIIAWVHTQRKHPLLKIHVGLYIDHSVLNDVDSCTGIENLFKRIAEEKDFIPVAHYSSRNSPDVVQDIRIIAKRIPSAQKVQLNDASDNYLSNLKEVSKHFACIAPLSTDNFALIDNPEFRDIVSTGECFVLLDDSKGTGKSKPIEDFQEKIGRCLNYGINNISLAGGFGPDSLETYRELKGYYKINFSIDAETKLHTNGELDTEKVKKYLKGLLYEH